MCFTCCLQDFGQCFKKCYSKTVTKSLLMIVTNFKLFFRFVPNFFILLLKITSKQRELLTWSGAKTRNELGEPVNQKYLTDFHFTCFYVMETWTLISLNLQFSSFKFYYSIIRFYLILFILFILLYNFILI